VILGGVWDNPDPSADQSTLHQTPYKPFGDEDEAFMPID